LRFTRFERMFVAMPGNWRDGFEYAYAQPDPAPEGPGLVWRETGANYWSGSSGSQPRGTVMLETSGLWVAYVRLEDPPGLSPITTVGRYATVEEAQVATDEVWASLRG
jgi:hypothetical protein